MEIIRGVVEATSAKEVQTKFGVKPAYRIKVNGTWLDWGFKKLTVKKGDKVEVVYDPEKYNRIESIKTLESDSATQKVFNGGGSQQQQQSSSNRDTQITRLSILRTAAEAMESLGLTKVLDGEPFTGYAEKIEAFALIVKTMEDYVNNGNFNHQKLIEEIGNIKVKKEF